MTASPLSRRLWGLLLGLLTYAVSFRLRMLEWPSWQEVEFRLGNEMLLATHDAYHWVAGAEGFEFGAGHPMSELLRVLALLTGSEPAAVAFWLPPIMASLVALLVFLWAWSMGSMEAGVCAGILASLSPGFLARTLLGYSDTDLITLFLPLLISLIPACWAMRYLRHPLPLSFRTALPPAPVLPHPRVPTAGGLIAPFWTGALACSGLLNWWAQEWHSLFPYLIRYNVGLLIASALLLSRREERPAALLAALIMAFPALFGPSGLALAAAALFLRPDRAAAEQSASSAARLLLQPVFLAASGVLIAVSVLDVEIFSTLLHHIQGYLKRSGDPAVTAVVADPLIYPSVAQSIIEIQDLSLPEMLVYFHPWQPVALIGVIGFVAVLCTEIGALFLLPLVGLALLSTHMGGRMVMFGAPIAALGLALPFDRLVCALGAARARTLRRCAACAAVLLIAGATLLPEAVRALKDFCLHSERVCLPALLCALVLLFIGIGRRRGWRAAVQSDNVGPHLLYRSAAALLLLLAVVPPTADLIPAMTHGPILNRRHADGLRSARKATDENAVLWLWWDWGYAAHHFARRRTIADGAAHGGPSLYLPAAVFTTHNPRLARQIIKYTALHDNVPADVLKNLSATQAAALMRKLAAPDTPLIQAPGKQYIEVSFDMLSLGFWITTFGNWDFLQKEGRGYAISIVPQQLAYRLDKGEVVMQGTTTAVPAASIDLFEDGRLVHRNYLTPEASLPHDPKALREWKEDAEKRRNVHFLFNRVTGEKLVVDDNMYNTLMTRLLLCPPDDPALSPYFRMIFDNVFCRIYEVL